MQATQSNRGGARAGAGRKTGEGSLRVTVPSGCLDAVLRLVAEYRASKLSPSPFAGLPAALVDANRRNLGTLADYCDDLPGFLRSLKAQKSGEFRRAWDSLPSNVKVASVKPHKTPDGVYRAGGRAFPGEPHFLRPMVLWLADLG